MGLPPGEDWGVGNEVLVADRSDRGKLRFTGEQRAWFLHQILTQSFEDMKPGESREAAMITAHGRMTGYLEALATQDAIFAHFEPELKDSLPESIRRYVFATRVEIEDVSDELGLVLIAGDGWLDCAKQTVAVPRIHETKSLGIPAGYAWIDRAYLSEALTQLGKAGARPTTEEELEAIRIEHGVPRWGNEMDNKTFPQEAGIDERAVHYDKGCYLGQEAMAKIHFRGKVNRRVVKLMVEGHIDPGTELSIEDKKVGSITSAAKGRALALVNHTVEAGAQLSAGEVLAKVVA
jgi:folate-binding protein YgfZ